MTSALLQVDAAGFEQAMEEAREKSRAAGKKAGVSTLCCSSCGSSSNTSTSGRHYAKIAHICAVVADAHSILSCVLQSALVLLLELYADLYTAHQQLDIVTI